MAGELPRFEQRVPWVSRSRPVSTCCVELDEVSAPSRSLLFNLGGTFSYRFEPLLEGKPKKLKGKWSALDRSITFTIGDKSWRVDTRIAQVDGGAGDTTELVITGDPPQPSMAATFRRAPARLP